MTDSISTKSPAGRPAERSRKRTDGSLVDQVYRKILAMITDGGVSGGEKLPSESEMATKLGVSRPVVRHALSRLQHAGVVEVRWGAGTYVQNTANVQAPETSYGPVRSLEEVRHSYVFRASVEGDAAALAAETRSEAGIAEIRLALEKLQSALHTSVEAQEADLAFHLAIANASGNVFYAKVIQSMRRTVEFSISLTRTLTLTHPEARLLTVQGEHENILRAIEAGDGEAARLAMRLHLKNAWERLFLGPAA